MQSDARLALTLVLVACGTPQGDSSCDGCTALFASIGVEVVHLDGQPALGLDAKTVHVASGVIVHALTDNVTGFYTIADDNTQVRPAGEQFRFIVLNDSAELASRDVEIGSDECSCHIEAIDVPMRIVLP